MQLTGRPSKQLQLELGMAYISVPDDLPPRFVINVNSAITANRPSSQCVSQLIQKLPLRRETRYTTPGAMFFGRPGSPKVHSALHSMGFLVGTNRSS